jgi:ketosteroid isomerase-like protein
MNADRAREFCSAWVEAWNAHDLEGVLFHFADDAVFTSPVAMQLLPETGGALRGKDAIRRYWTIGLNQIPDLAFTIENIYVGVDTVVINYRNQTGGLVNEVLHLNDVGLVERGAGTYLLPKADGDEAGA